MNYFLKCWMLICFLVLFLFSCTPKKINFIVNEDIFVMPMQSEGSNVSFSNLALYEDGDTNLILGNVKKPYRSKAPKGHLDLIIHSETREILKAFSVDSIPREFYKGKKNEAKFQVEMPSFPPGGTMIHIAFHALSINSDTYMFDCGLNMADSNNISSK